MVRSCFHFFDGNGQRLWWVGSQWIEENHIAPTRLTVDFFISLWAFKSGVWAAAFWNTTGGGRHHCKTITEDGRSMSVFSVYCSSARADWPSFLTTNLSFVSLLVQFFIFPQISPQYCVDLRNGFLALALHGVALYFTMPKGVLKWRKALPLPPERVLSQRLRCRSGISSCKFQKAKITC